MPSGASGASASEPASVLRRCAKAACTSADTRGRGRRAGARACATSADSTLGSGWNTVRGTRRTTLTSHASWASTEVAP